MTKHKSLWVFACAASLAALPGCGSGPTLYTISGEVTYQGEPVREGQIIFADADGKAPTAHGTIEQGKYTIQTTAGVKQVRITATKETGKMIQGAMDVTYPEIVDLIPAKYNSATTLQNTVEPEGPRVIDFRLE